jgi:hypothetical protein
MGGWEGREQEAGSRKQELHTGLVIPAKAGIHGSRTEHGFPLARE